LADDRVPAGPPGKKKRGWRRSLTIALAIVAAFVLYAIAFQTTDVSLDQLQSETRREQLYKILRALARPDLIHYDQEDLIVEAPILVPCNPSVELPASSGPGTGPTLTVEPSCASPGDLVTVLGSGFRADVEVSLKFVPDSEFDVTLPLDRIQTSAEGTFTFSFEVPERTSDNPQFVRAVTSIPIGSWSNRVEVWTDTNLNGVRDPSALPASDQPLSASPLPLPEFTIRDPGGVALIDENGNPIELLSWGGAFEARSGSTAGLASTDIGVDPFAVGEGESVQRTGRGAVPEDFAWVGPAAASFGELNAGQEPFPEAIRSRVFINELAFGASPQVEVAGPPGSALRNLTLIFFDGEDGKQYKSVKLGDTIELSPRLSDNAINTWDRIVETVMLAFLATTVGTMLAVPLSFIAARNLMRDVKVPLINLGLAILGIPVGLVLGVQIARWARQVALLVEGNWVLDVAALVGVLLAIWRGAIWAVDVDEEATRTIVDRVARPTVMFLAAVGFFVAQYLSADLLMIVGTATTRAVGFIGNFLFTMGEIVQTITTPMAALVGAGIIAQLGSRSGYLIRTKLPRSSVKILEFPIAAAAGATVAVFVGAVVEWFGQFGNPVATVYVPAAVGALYGLYLAFRALKNESVGTGIVIYYIARTVFNALRSIEPLVMVIVFVVWVGIGPFAGSLALALHTTAALAKLYSEQVESISSGPLEAIRATGATRMQTIVYAVVPQIVPPYISFTMYRWDINVRMSTIIGFAGGGGIGFLLQQNINLLQYRQAAAQMLAIAIVVASMDYLSSRLRERFV